MRRLVQGWTLLLLALLAGGPAAAQSVLQACANKQHLQVTLGIPREYANAARKFGYEKVGENQRQVCGVVALGTPYQLLSWMENGSLQAAVLSDFAVAVMESDDPERFERDFYVFPVQALPSLPNVERRLLLTDGIGTPVVQPYARLDDLFNALRRPAPEESILVPSHLSPAVPYLIRYATAWAERQELGRPEREAFYAALLAAIRFGDPAIPGKPSVQPATYQLVDEILSRSSTQRESLENEVEPDPDLNLVLSDRLVVRKRVLLASRELRTVVSDTIKQDKGQAIEPRDVALFAHTRAQEEALGPTLTRFREANYRRVQFGTVAQRHFRFTIPELWTLLQNMDAPAGDAPGRLALVLTGGGVKAAYQTSMIDYLYDEQRLINSGASERRPYSQQVDYVIGTSGGALLGVFVAAMDEKFDALRRGADANRLTAILWKEPGDGIRSYDVFPFLDMMRYASLIVALIVVWMIAVVLLAMFRSHYPQVTRIDHSEESFFGRRARAWKESWPWILLLVTAPIIISKVAGVNRVEHMPTETGLYYAWMALVAFYSDVRLYPVKPFEWLRARLDWKTLAVAALGAALIGVALWRPFADAGMLYVNLACAGFVALIHALHLFFHAQTEYFRAEPRTQIFGAFGVLLGIVFLSYFGVVFAMWLEATSLLEMHGGFWMYFLAFAALFTGLYFWLGRAGHIKSARNWAQASLGYLFSEYRSRAMFGSERRFMRFMTMTVLAWVWWNMLAAPALYGNRNAREYLDGAFQRFTTIAHGQQPTGESRVSPGPAADPDDVTAGVEFPLAVPFVITATSLEKSQERYFLFVSGEDDVIDASLSPEAWFNVVRDPRWVVVRKPVDRELQHAAFASGSPFPVFSAHDVKLRALRNNERLIDGGFAHNKPLEAAFALGARKVLVLNSSPLEAGTGAGACTLMSLNVGELACNLPKLLPYLWERSQVEDLLSTRSMVVASIYPTAPDGVWPSLTDFRRETVQELLANAALDRKQRVGVIESWGAPQFAPAGLFGYDANQISAVLKGLGR
jgi:predicted acylesterase/phospholipase RssA